MKSKRKHLFSMIILCMMICLGLSFKGNVQAATSNTYTIYVNRHSNLVNVVNTKTGKLVRAMYCSTGKNNGTITGTYRTKAKYRWRELYGNVYGQYATRINGPYLFHSVPYYKTSCSQVETKEYNKLGKQASQGCIRLAVVDCKWIYDHCKIGTKVVINDSKKLKKPSRSLLKISTKKKAGWDPTDPNSNNPYYPTLKLKSSSYKTVKLGHTFKYTGIINVSSKFTDSKTFLSKVKVKGSVNINKVGSYKVTYSLTDPATELTKKLTVTFKVVK